MYAIIWLVYYSSSVDNSASIWARGPCTESIRGFSVLINVAQPKCKVKRRLEKDSKNLWKLRNIKNVQDSKDNFTYTAMPVIASYHQTHAPHGTSTGTFCIHARLMLYKVL